MELSASLICASKFMIYVHDLCMEYMIYFSFLYFLLSILEHALSVFDISIL